MKPSLLGKSLAAITLLLTFSAFAKMQSGFIKNVIEDDDGIKVILSKSASAAKEIETVYLINTDADFRESRDLIMKAKAENAKVQISQGDVTVGP